ncbi:CYTH domain-containing protein [Sphaerotilus hippei]|uniref:CYTH domain-containing protein n=1 Tax=Sphaerotilus hippei TaxID=744406 RepID=A0A318GW03_9BURK|nr:CYTH and CHAD domain-containing protein [Sphaerotilus hippei]PXW93666.1 CYTH domain-containing protein [Sphaerotilus hippei]
MQEVELKFQVPAGHRSALRRAVTTRRAQVTELQARYFDTPQRHLARAGFAVRLRRENAQWVQTLKGGGDGLMKRLEHNAPVATPPEGEPGLDLSRHVGTPAGDALEALLKQQGIGAADLQRQYGTDVRRTHRLLRHEGAVVELAFDEGHILSGDQAVELFELEFELVSGPVPALLSLARRWVDRHGLWLDSRTKAERGDRLVRGLTHGPAVRARTVQLSRETPAAEAVRRMMLTVMRQVLPNASDLADGLGTPEHLHQLRVGLRRLRTVLKVHGPWLAVDDPARLAGLEAGLATLFTTLGTARDQDALAESVLPALVAAGSPVGRLPTPPVMAEPAGLLRGVATQRLWLEVLALASAPVAERPVDVPAGAAAEVSAAAPAVPALEPAARAGLKAQHRRVLRDAGRFLALDEAGRHGLRKRLKRLRYSAELVAALYAPKAVRAYLDGLRAAQEVLGRCNDLSVARERFLSVVAQQPEAWFAVGWLSAERDRVVAEAAPILAELVEVKRFWRASARRRH